MFVDSQNHYAIPYKLYAKCVCVDTMIGCRERDYGSTGYGSTLSTTSFIVAVNIAVPGLFGDQG